MKKMEAFVVSVERRLQRQKYQSFSHSGSSGVSERNNMCNIRSVMKVVSHCGQQRETSVCNPNQYYTSKCVYTSW